MNVTRDLLESWNVDVSAKGYEALCSLEGRGSFEAGRPTGSDGLVSYLLWKPHILDRRKSTAIVSSRLGRDLDRKDAFFRILRIACAQLDPRKQILLSAEETATYPYVVRAAALFGIDVITVRVPDKRLSLEAWLQQLSATVSENRTTPAVFVSPPLPGVCLSQPLRDQVMMQHADQVLAMHVRSTGTIMALLQKRLRERSPGQVFLAVGSDELVSRKVAAPLMKQGAIGWFVTSSEAEPAVLPFLDNHTNRRDPQPIIHISELKCLDRFLTHCTRSANGPWPNQSESDFLDELILGDKMRDRSALAALTRIVGQRRILATSEAIRNGTPVVSLTAVPLNELSTLRRFRSHRGRWDFEPYGVAIDRDYLTGLGAREVIYGNEATWRSLSPTQKPFFQKLGDKANSIDWCVEKEFRVLDDIDLDLVPAGQAIVFVPTQEEAEHVAKISNWPVLVITS